MFLLRSLSFLSLSLALLAPLSGEEPRIETSYPISADSLEQTGVPKGKLTQYV